MFYTAVTLSFLASYFYFLLFKKEKHKFTPELDTLSSSFMLNRISKEWWMWMTAPVENYFVRKKVAPSTITYASLFFSAIACVGFSFGDFVWAGWAIVFAGTCDLLDGRIARRIGRQTKWGDFLDSTIDRWCEILWYLGLFNFYANTLFFYVVFIALITSFMISYVKARGESLHVSSKMGIMQRSERIVWLGVSSVLSPLFSATTHYFAPVSTTFLASVGISVIAIVNSYTYYERSLHISKQLK